MDDELDIIDEIQCERFGFCGCGNPEANLLYVLGGLALIGERRPNYFTTDPATWNAWNEEHHKRAALHFGNDSAESFFYYWCDKEKLTQHGGSIPGWLTEEGQNLLNKLLQFKQELEDQQ